MDEKYKAVAIGTSSGGLEALSCIIAGLKSDFILPVLIVQHLSPHSESYLAKHLQKIKGHNVKEASDKETIENACIYIAPPNYHILIEQDKSISLSTENKVNFSRPSIDILFETSAEAYTRYLIGIILTGASSDGSKGIIRIKEYGGTTISQAPSEAKSKTMPESAIKTGKIDKILTLSEISDFLNSL